MRRLTVVVMATLLTASVSGLHHGTLGFAVEPAAQVSYTNSSGALVDCRALGPAASSVTWTLDTGQRLADVPQLRSLLENGSLWLKPFEAGMFRRDVHSATIRCVISSSLDTIVSRSVQLSPVVLQRYAVTSRSGSAPRGQTALLTCHVPVYLTGIVQVTSWSVNGQHNVYPSAVPGDKYHMLPSGELLVYHVTGSDSRGQYLCRTVHMLTGRQTVSDTPASVHMDSAAAGGAELVASSPDSVVAKEDEDVVLFCIAHGGGSKTPPVRWIRSDGTSLGRLGTVPSQVLVLNSVRVRDSGQYSCTVDGTAGRQTRSVHLRVQAPLSVHLTPVKQTVNLGEPFHLQCRTSIGTRVEWLKDGVKLGHDLQHSTNHDGGAMEGVYEVSVDSMSPAHSGLYQCLVTDNHVQSEQAVAQVLLGDSGPVLLETFSNHTVHPLTAVTLRCVAHGSPTPQIYWSLDGRPLSPGHRRRISQYVTADNDVISQVNLTSTRAEDGGLVTCAAVNRLSTTRHSARLNVYGAPVVRHMSHVSAVKGQHLSITCSVGGYPINYISWSKDGHQLPVDSLQTVFPNGTLQLRDVTAARTTGVYNCTAVGHAGVSSTGQLNVKVLARPEIRPFSMGVYTSGDRLRAVCFVQSGDAPLRILWLKDGSPLQDPLIAQGSADPYSSSLFAERVDERQAGNYTCRAENAVGVDSLSAQLIVHVAPSWLERPQDTAVPVGTSLILPCSARGIPPPTVVWTKQDGDVWMEMAGLFGSRMLENGSLSMSGRSAQAQGVYKCRVSNEVGSALHAQVTVLITEPPAFSTPERTIVIRAGQNVTLTCDPAGQFPMQLTWTRAGLALADGHRLYVHRWTSAANVSRAILRILSSHPSDSDSYSCSARNEHGTDTLRVSLHIEEAPPPPRGLHVVSLDSESVLLGWSPPLAIRTDSVTYRVQYKQQHDEWSSASSVRLTLPSTRVTGLLAGTDYTLRAFSLTSLGPGPIGPVLQLRTNQRPPSAPPTDVTVTSPDSQSLEVSWRAPPSDRHNGPLIGYTVHYTREPAGNPPVSLNVSASPVRLHGLLPYTVYSIRVSAYNGRGAGPLSAPRDVNTMEATPTAAPGQLDCAAISARRIRVSWQPPPTSRVHGRLHSYRVYVEALLERNGGLFSLVEDVKVTSAVLRNLRPFSNFSVSVAAATRAGVGVASRPVICTTEQDVPSEPAATKVCVTSLNSAVVSWLPPSDPNGPIIAYIVFIRAASEDASSVAETQRLVAPSATSVPLQQLTAGVQYSVRVAAQNPVGVGRPARPQRFVTKHNVAVGVVSLDRVVSVAAGSQLTLPCLHVGQKPRQARWFRQNTTLPYSRFSIGRRDSLLIERIAPADAGNYTCHVTNQIGTDRVVYSLIVFTVPSPASLRIIESAVNSILIGWDLANDNSGLVVRSYVLEYGSRDRPVGSQKVKLSRTARQHRVTDLLCGSVYHFWITVNNRLGSSAPSVVLVARTSGHLPRLTSSDLVTSSSPGQVTVALSSWTGGECPIRDYNVQWNGSDDYSGSVLLSGDQRVFTINRTSLASGLAINVTAINDAGATSHLVAVHPSTDSASDMNAAAGKTDSEVTDSVTRVTVPLVTSLVCVLLIVTATLLCYRRRRRKAPLYLQDPPDYSQDSWELDRVKQGHGPTRPRLIPQMNQSQKSSAHTATDGATSPIYQRPLAPTSTAWCSAPPAGAYCTTTLLSDAAPPLEHQYYCTGDRYSSVSTGWRRQRCQSVPASEDCDSAGTDGGNGAADLDWVRSRSLRRDSAIRPPVHSRSGGCTVVSTTSSESPSPQMPATWSASLTHRRARPKRRRTRRGRDPTAVVVSRDGGHGAPFHMDMQLHPRPADSQATGRASLRTLSTSHSLAKHQDFSINV